MQPVCYYYIFYYVNHFRWSRMQNCHFRAHKLYKQIFHAKLELHRNDLYICCLSILTRDFSFYVNHVPCNSIYYSSVQSLCTLYVAKAAKKILHIKVRFYPFMEWSVSFCIYQQQQAVLPKPPFEMSKKNV